MVVVSHILRFPGFWFELAVSHASQPHIAFDITLPTCIGGGEVALHDTFFHGDKSEQVSDVTSILLNSVSLGVVT